MADGFPETQYDYVVVGSGGPVAANLGGAGESASYEVPAFHGLATEDPARRWDYFVDHASIVPRIPGFFIVTPVYAA